MADVNFAKLHLRTETYKMFNTTGRIIYNQDSTIMPLKFNLKSLE